MSDSFRPLFTERASTCCPRCEGSQIVRIPANNPGSLLGWFRCSACDHIWSQGNITPAPPVAEGGPRPDDEGA